jgi:hypothetical protein
LSDDEIERVRQTTGHVVCPGTKFGNRKMGSGALIVSNDLIITNAHVLIDENGRRREPLAKCFFSDPDSPVDEGYLSADAGSYRFGTEHPFRRLTHDPNGS